MTDALPVLAPVADAARLGAWCPKLCTFACPVTAATGRDDAVPWSFHRVVTDLLDERRTPEEVADRVTACTGCLACRQPCTFDLDVPAQVRAARAATGPTTEQARSAVAAVASGQRPAGADVPTDADATGVGQGVVLWVGCGDTADTIEASTRLLAAAGHVPQVVSDGCCGALADDLGAPEVATDRRDALATLDRATTVVARDPHCLGSLGRVADDVVDLWSFLDASDALVFDTAPARVTYQDPCLLARGTDGPGPARRLLARAGFRVVDPEFSGVDVACSGAGMGMPLVDPGAARATARRRRDHLEAAGAQPVTACGRAADLLDQAGLPPTDLAVLLAGRLPAPTSSSEPDS